MGRWVVESILHGGPIGLFLVPARAGMTKALVCGMMRIKESLLLIGRSSTCGNSRFPLSLSAWSFTICMIHFGSVGDWSDVPQLVVLI